MTKTIEFTNPISQSVSCSIQFALNLQTLCYSSANGRLQEFSRKLLVHNRIRTALNLQTLCYSSTNERLSPCPEPSPSSWPRSDLIPLLNPPHRPAHSAGPRTMPRTRQEPNKTQNPYSQTPSCKTWGGGAPPARGTSIKSAAPSVGGCEACSKFHSLGLSDLRILRILRSHGLGAFRWAVPGRAPSIGFGLLFCIFSLLFRTLKKPGI